VRQFKGLHHVRRYRCISLSASPKHQAAVCNPRYPCSLPFRRFPPLVMLFNLLFFIPRPRSEHRPPPGRYFPTFPTHFLALKAGTLLCLFFSRIAASHFCPSLVYMWIINACLGGPKSPFFKLFVWISYCHL